MKILGGVLFLIGIFALNDASSLLTMKRVAVDQMLINHLMQAGSTETSYAQPCFAIYLPIFSDILNEFESSYKLCISNAESQEAELDAEASANRTLIKDAAQGVCNSMIECSALDDSLPFFDCYSEVGGTNVKTLYSLTNDATEVAANLREAYRVVENNMVKCQNESERAYVQETAITNEALKYCLANGPPTVVTTEAPAVTETTTVSSTDEPTTEDATTKDATTEDTTLQAADSPVDDGYEVEDLGEYRALNKHQRSRRSAAN